MTPQTINIRCHGVDFDVCLDGDEGLASFWSKYQENAWDPDALSFLMQFVQPNELFVDIGAWVGPLSLLAAARGARVIAFEPDEVAYSRLERTVELNPKLQSRISLIQAAISDVGGPGILFSPDENFGASVSSLIPYGKNPKTMLVNRMDARETFEILLKMGVKLIKIDTEGCEYKMIPKASDIIEKYKPTLLISFHGFIFKNKEHPILEAIHNFSSILMCLRHYEYIYVVDKGDLIRATPDKLLTMPFFQGTMIFASKPPL